MAKLIISLGTEVMQTVQLNKERMTLGRHRHNDIVLDHKTVSGEHAVIVTILDDSYLEDLGSTNGSFVNGHRIGKHFLQNKDKITLAKFRIEFIADGIRPLSSGITDPVIPPLPVLDALPPLPPEPVLGEIEVLNGGNAGKKLVLSKPETTLGRAGVLVVLIRRKENGYTVMQSEGDKPALLNDAVLGNREQALKHGDVIDVSGNRMAFTVK